MLCKRIIGVVMVENGHVVRRKEFKTQSIVGKPVTTIKYLQNWHIDELFIINVGPVTDITKILDSALKYCFVPVTIGGSISTFKEAAHYIRNGADKIVIGKHKSKQLINEIAGHYGDQAVSVSIDENHKKEYEKIKSWPIGEVVFHDKTRDGKGLGLNLDISKIETTQPKILMGGVGRYEDIVEGLGHADAVAVGNLFSFKELSARLARNMAKEKGIIVR